jgi:mono/diheme cytochrome c family protein
MKKLLFAIPPLVLAAFLALNTAAPSNRTPVFAQAAAPEQAAPPDQTAPPDQATAASAPVPDTNPVKPTAESEARATSMYKIDCAMCHGENGNGKGDLVADMGLKMQDWHDPATLQGKSDRDIYMLIRDGKGKMPSEGDRAKPDEIWNLVILVRGFSKK